MNSQEAFRGIRKIEALYQGKFTPADIGPIWPRLLELPESALVRAIGEARMIWRRMPTGHELLAAVNAWSQKEETAKVVEQFDEGKENFTLMMAWLDGRINKGQYVAALYEMASKYGRAEYAEHAASLESEGGEDAEAKV